MSSHPECRIKHVVSFREIKRRRRIKHSASTSEYVFILRFSHHHHHALDEIFYNLKTFQRHRVAGIKTFEKLVQESAI